MAMCIKIGPYAVHWVLFYDSREPLSSWEVSPSRPPWETKVWDCGDAPQIAKDGVFVIRALSTVALPGQPCLSHKRPGIPEMEMPAEEYLKLYY